MTIDRDRMNYAEKLFLRGENTRWPAQNPGNQEDPETLDVMLHIG